MPDYDMEEFLAEQRGRTEEQILRAVEQEVIRIDYKLRGRARARARAAGAEAYRRRLWLLRASLRTAQEASESAPGQGAWGLERRNLAEDGLGASSGNPRPVTR
jgi:hypothetical protein